MFLDAWLLIISMSHRFRRDQQVQHRHKTSVWRRCWLQFWREFFLRRLDQRRRQLYLFHLITCADAQPATRLIRSAQNAAGMPLKTGMPEPARPSPRPHWPWPAPAGPAPHRTCRLDNHRKSVALPCWSWSGVRAVRGWPLALDLVRPAVVSCPQGGVFFPPGRAAAAARVPLTVA
jgi:hypothetical protein